MKKVVELSKNLSNLQIMGVINMTPDSFFDGGKHNSLTNSIKHANELINCGANILDIGGESSRPNASIVNLETEIKRIIPLIKYLKKNSNYRISVDTYKPQVMQKTIELKVDMINDIFALTKKGAIEVCSDFNGDICLMHMQNNPQIMQNNPKYSNIIDEMKDFFDTRINCCIKGGIDASKLIIDPGFGFGKSYSHNLEILKNLDKFKIFGLRILVGLSRKSMFDKLLGGRDIEGRMVASTVAAGIAITRGASIIRTHDTIAVNDMIKTMRATYE